jgi:hypothetical protein
VFGGLNRPLAAAAVAAAFLVAPSAALACGSGTSAVDVYSECLQSGGGGKPTSGSGGSSGPLYVSPQTAKALKKAGSDGQALSNLVRGYTGARLLQLHASSAGQPTTVGSAFDLGSGPTVLLIALAGAAVLLLGATGVRSVRQRRH